MRIFLLTFVLAGVLSAAAGGEGAADLYNHGRYSEAVRILQSQSAPADAHTLQLLGQCYYMLGDFGKATDALEHAAAAAPKNSMIQTWLGRAWGMRAESAFPLAAIGQAGKTRDAFERALKLDPKNQEALGDLFDFYMDAPGMVGGGLHKAEGLLPHYAQFDPLGFHIASARLAEKKQQYSAAEASFRKAVETAPRSVSVILELAQYLSRRGRHDESEREFEHAAQVAPGAPAILFARASAYIKGQRNAPQARELLKRYLALSDLTPDDPPRWEAKKLLRKVEGA